MPVEVKDFTDEVKVHEAREQVVNEPVVLPFEEGYEER